MGGRYGARSTHGQRHGARQPRALGARLRPSSSPIGGRPRTYQFRHRTAPERSLRLVCGHRRLDVAVRGSTGPPATNCLVPPATNCLARRRRTALSPGDHGDTSGGRVRWTADGRRRRRRRPAGRRARPGAGAARRGRGPARRPSSRCVYSSWGSVRICSRVPTSTSVPFSSTAMRCGEDLDDGEVVGDEQAGEADLALQLLEQVEHPGLHRHVERRRRLVGDQQARAEREGPGDADALALPAGQLVRVAVAQVAGQVHLVEQLLDPLAERGALGDLLQQQRLADRLADRQPRVQRRPGVLEHEADVAAHARRSSLEMPTMFVPSTDGRRPRRTAAARRSPDRSSSCPTRTPPPARRPRRGRSTGRRRRRHGTPAPGRASGTRWRRRARSTTYRARRAVSRSAAPARDPPRSRWRRSRRGAARRASSCWV